MYGRKAMGATLCMAGVWPRLKIASPLQSSPELPCEESGCGESGCWESDCAIRASARPKNRVVRTSSKRPPGFQDFDRGSQQLARVHPFTLTLRKRRCQAGWVPLHAFRLGKVRRTGRASRKKATVTWIGAWAACDRARPTSSSSGTTGNHGSSATEERSVCGNWIANQLEWI